MTNLSDIAKLAQRAVLVSVNIRVWQGQKRDSEVSREIAGIKNSEPSRGHFVKQLVSGQEYRDLHNAASTLRRVHMQYTFPWNTGIRILAKSQWLKYSEEMQNVQNEFDTAARNLSGALPRLKTAAKQELGALYNEDDYPTSEGILESCGILISTLPIPESGDWRLDLSDAATEALRGSIEEQVRATFSEMNKEAFNRIQEASQWLITTMEKDVRERTFSNHMINKVLGICENVEALGLYNPVLSDAVVRVRSLLNQSEESLHKDPLVRAETRKQAEDIFNTLSACMPNG